MKISTVLPCLFLPIFVVSCGSSNQAQAKKIENVELEKVSLKPGNDGQITIEGIVRNRTDKSQGGAAEFMVYDLNGKAFGTVRAIVDAIPPNQQASFAIPAPPTTRGFVWSGFLDR